MADITKIKITAGGKEYTIRKPPEFEPKREDVYGAEYTTCTGKYIADRIGWKYSDMSLTWDALPQSEVEALIAMTGECTFTFDDPAAEEQTESVIEVPLYICGIAIAGITPQLEPMKHGGNLYSAILSF